MTEQLPADLIFLVENEAGNSTGLVVEAGGNVFVFASGVSTRVSLNQVTFGV